MLLFAVPIQPFRWIGIVISHGISRTSAGMQVQSNRRLDSLYKNQPLVGLAAPIQPGADLRGYGGLQCTELTHQNRRYSGNGKPCSSTYAFELAMAFVFSFSHSSASLSDTALARPTSAACDTLTPRVLARISKASATETLVVFFRNSDISAGHGGTPGRLTPRKDEKIKLYLA